jgi:hypothetical protein
MASNYTFENQIDLNKNNIKKFENPHREPPSTKLKVDSEISNI